MREGTLRAGYELNCPLLTRVERPHAGALPPCFATAAVEGEGVIVDTVKKAEDSKDLIVRVYEAHGQRGPAALSIAVNDAPAEDARLLIALLERAGLPTTTRGHPARAAEE
jgi:alpha-mannosidase